MNIVLETRDDREIIETYAGKVPFPKYWAYNWNSFEECLSDALKSGQGITVQHQYSIKDLGESSVYFDIIRDTA